MPLTVVTGYFGMNFQLPRVRLETGEWFALGVLAATALATWWYPAARRWYWCNIRERGSPSFS